MSSESLEIDPRDELQVGGLDDALARERQQRELAERRLRAALVALKTARAASAAATGADEAHMLELLAMANHQMRGPLASILNVFSLLSDTALTPEQGEWVATGLHGARALHYQINQLTELSQLQTRGGELESGEVAVADLLDDVADLFLPQARAEQVQLFARLAPDAARRQRCDVGRLRQILINLLALALGSHRSDRVFLEANVVDDWLVLTALVPAPREADAGVEAGLRSAAEPGELGLLITRRVAELLGGQVTLQSDESGGLVLEARLPWRPAEEPRDDKIETLREALGKLRLALLASGDERHPRVAATLERWGVSVRTFGRVRELLNSDYQPDLVIAEGEDVKLLRAVARSGARCLGILPQFGTGPELGELPEKLLVHRLPASERELLVRIVRPEDQRVANNGDSRIPRAGHRCTVLVAEDNLANRMITTRLLEKMGHKVHGVSDGREAVTACRQIDFDVVLMDLKMPVLDGLDATRRILDDRQVHCPPAVIALTGDVTSSRRAECVELGMRAFLAKPVDPSELAEVVDEHGHATQLARLRHSLSSHEKLPLVDRTALRRMAKEVDASLIPDVGAQFLLELDERLEQASRSAELGDLTRVRETLEPLHGLAASFGARQLAAVMGQVEKLAATGERELLGQFLSVLLEVAARTTAGLDAEMKKLET